MRSRALRMTLTLLATAAILTAAYLCWAVQSQINAEINTAAAFERTRTTAVRQAYELQFAQQAYVASGQNETFWFGKVAEAADSLRTALSMLRSSTTFPAALASLDEAEAALQDFEQIDRRALNYASGGQKLLASDVIFSDGLEAAARITTALDRAGTAVAESSGRVAAEGVREQAMTIAAAAAVTVLVLLLLMPIAAKPYEVTVQAPQPEPVRVSDNSEGLDLSLLDGEMREKPVRRMPAKQIPPAAVPAQHPSLEMQSIANVCTELARLSDTSRLPAILERTAGALDASGLVLWIADQDGKELLPLAAYGYPASVLSRMGSLKADAENATAAAFRTGLLQTVSANAVSNGAIAAPLVTPTGCRGVMSAEVRHDAEKQPARLAAASIVAAQLASLVGPPATRAEEPDTATV
jgi:hypothetical protein